MNLAATEIPLIPSVSALASRYDAWLCDIWGVMHNGVRPFASASEACRRFRENGGTLVLISNSPRPHPGVIRQLARIGVPEDAWDGVVTSGDITRSLILENGDKRLFHLGPERDKGIFEGMELSFAAAEEAELVVCSGLYDDEKETPDDYAAVLQDMAGRGLPMICANPDLMVERGPRLIYCAGSLAAAYETLGGEVIYAGKPHPPIYERALGLISDIRGGEVNRERVLAIGDGLKTDIAGAARAGLDALFVASGLHVEGGGERDVEAAEIAKLFEGNSARPLAAQARLAW